VPCSRNSVRDERRSSSLARPQSGTDPAASHVSHHLHGASPREPRELRGEVSERARSRVPTRLRRVRRYAPVAGIMSVSGLAAALWVADELAGRLPGEGSPGLDETELVGVALRFQIDLDAPLVMLDLSPRSSPEALRARASPPPLSPPNAYACIPPCRYATGNRGQRRSLFGVTSL
jgi:hypothetical protein